MPDRRIPPHITEIEALELPPVAQFTLDNGLKVHAIDAGTQDVVKIELVFRAGRPFEKQQIVSRATAGMLKEGTAQRSAAELAEWFDFHGATLATPSTMDTVAVTLYSLHSQLGKVLPVFAEMLESPAFPEAELETYIRRNQKMLLEDLTKNDTVAYRKFTEMIFGEQHPYGYNSSPESYALLTRPALLEHFDRCYTADNGFVVVSGKLNDEILGSLNQTLGQLSRRGKAEPTNLPAFDTKPERLHIDRPHHNQTAIRLGRRLFDRRHPDFFGIYILNTILGDYFGSRLMGSIREDKGYTYNIYSSIDTMQYGGALYIGTEVAHESLKKTLKQVYKEIDRLRQEPVEEQELAMVRSYLMGSYLSMLDGPFNTAELVKTLVTEELPLSFFTELVRKTKQVSAAELQELAIRYLHSEDFWLVSVGKAIPTKGKKRERDLV